MIVSYREHGRYRARQMAAEFFPPPSPTHTQGLSSSHPQHNMGISNDTGFPV